MIAETRRVRVCEAVLLSPTLRRLVLEPQDGGRFTAARAGAHVLVAMNAGGRIRRNAYSLTALPNDRGEIEIVVRRVAGSRGGSAFLHESVREGDILEVALPQNLFPIAKLARAHVLLAAGVGVTPFLTYLPALAAAGIPCRLHQFCRREEADAFGALLSAHAPAVTIHAGHDRPPLASLLSDKPLGTHVSVCGPDGFMTQVQDAAQACGFAPSRIHRESFGGAAVGAPFVAILARSGRRIKVDAEMSLLEALEQAGIDAPSLCRGGACGQCRVGVLSGRADHRCHVLSPDQRARGDAMMTCVSRAATAELVLDL